MHKLPSHEEYSYHNHYVSQTSPDVSAEETWKANGTLSRPSCVQQETKLPAITINTQGRPDIRPLSAKAASKRPLQAWRMMQTVVDVNDIWLLPAGRSESGSGGGRPKLQLQPRSAPLPASGDAGAEPKQAAPGASGARPKLQLQPRSKPVENGGSRQSSLFGAARPREEILKVHAQPSCNIGSCCPNRSDYWTLCLVLKR